MSSAIAAKKAQQLKGKEGLLFFSGITCGAISGILALLHYLLKWELSHTTITPIVYFLMLAGLCLGTASYIRENRDNTNEILKNFLIALIIIGIVGGAVAGSYMW